MYNMRHTWITHLDGSKTLILWQEPITTQWVSIVTYPEIPDEDVKKIMEANQNDVQNLLSNFF